MLLVVKRFNLERSIKPACYSNIPQINSANNVTTDKNVPEDMTGEELANKRYIS